MVVLGVLLVPAALVLAAVARSAPREALTAPMAGESMTVELEGGRTYDVAHVVVRGPVGDRVGLVASAPLAEGGVSVRGPDGSTVRVEDLALTLGASVTDTAGDVLDPLAAFRTQEPGAYRVTVPGGGDIVVVPRYSILHDGTPLLLVGVVGALLLVLGGFGLLRGRALERP
jgi:hypothetical protein